MATNSNPANPPFSLLVVGDEMIAHDILHPKGASREGVTYAPGDRMEVYKQSGGAWHVRKMLAALGTLDAAAAARPNSSMSKLPQAHTLWAPFQRRASVKGQFTFRVKEYLGTVRGNTLDVKEWDPKTPQDLLVLVDEGIGAPHKLDERHHAVMGNGGWRVVKGLNLSDDTQTGRPTSFSAVLAAGEAARTVVVVSAGGLRGMSLRLGQHQSWQTLLREAQSAVRSNEALKECAFVVVVFGPSAVLVLQPQTHGSDPREGLPGSAVLHRGELEGQWQHERPGGLVGYSSCVMALLVHELSNLLSRRIRDTGEVQCPLPKPVGERPPELKTVAQAVMLGCWKGLVAARLLHAEGYLHEHNNPARGNTLDYRGKALNEVLAGERTAPSQWATDAHNPTTWAVKTVSLNTSVFWNEAEVDAPPLKKLVAGCVKGVQVAALRKLLQPPGQDEVANVARRIVRLGLNGIGEASSIPYATFGQISEYDNSQIDVLSTIQALLKQHRKGSTSKPLSIAVFGPPGAGKSFTVKELAKLAGFGAAETLTFNLSQFHDAATLVGAFHQIAAKTIAGPPLVFFDEFDTVCEGRRLGWLRYFLAPMQDGEFTEGTQTLRLGAPVFVFAGGTFPSYDKFRSADEPSDPTMVGAKLPDFLSRLRATLDIPGVNPSPGDGRGLHSLRRAVILHQNLSTLASTLRSSGKLCIEDSVLNAFLDVNEYRHGARSIEAIIRNSALEGKSEFTASYLPPRHSLDLHVDANAFMQLVAKG